MWSDKFKVGLVHLALSAVVLSAIFALVFLFWYPYPYFLIQGVMAIVWISLVVALVAGPLLTFIVFKKGKRGMKFDLVVIVLMQIAALAYSTWVLHSERPWFMVYAVDRFNVLAAKDVDFSEIVDPTMQMKPLIGPLLLVSRLPDDRMEYQKLQDEVMFEGKPDVERRPRYWSHYADSYTEVLENAIPLSNLLDVRPNDALKFEDAASQAGKPVNELLYHPVMGKAADFAVVLNPEDGSIVGAIAVDPWIIN